MNSSRTLVWLAFLSPAVMLMAGIPLFLGLVAPNRFYGMRLPATLASPATWYELNGWLGAYAIIAGGVGLVTAALMVKFLKIRLEVRATISLCVTAFLVLAAVVASLLR